jgi:hypothetical protein
MYQISLGYASDSPDLRLTWLNNLADYHLSVQNFEEHSQCKIMSAVLICQYLHHENPEEAARLGVPSDLESFAGVCPNVEAFPPLIKDVEDTLKEGTFESRQFSFAGLMAVLKESLFSLRQGKRYELAIQVYDILVTLLQYEHKYEAMSRAFEDMNLLSKQLIEADLTGSRAFSSFYRVSFIGEKWGADLSGKAFIYKMDEFSHIAEVTALLESQLHESFPQVEDLVRLGNTTVEANDLKPGIWYWQIAAVKEYFGEGELYHPEKDTRRQSGGSVGAKRAMVKQELPKRGSLLLVNANISEVISKNSHSKKMSAALSGTPWVHTSNLVVPWHLRTSKWERKYNVRKFVLVQPFTKGKKGVQQSEGRPEDQWTRKSIFTVDHAFPFVNIRSVVVDTTVEELSPIETAIGQIEEQTRRLAIEAKKDELNSLQRVLQGAVLTQVNVGILHTAKQFLEGSKQSKSPYIPKMIRALKAFLIAAEAAIKQNQRLIGNEQLDLQEAFEQGLAKLQMELGMLFEKFEEN